MWGLIFFWALRKVWFPGSCNAKVVNVQDPTSPSWAPVYMHIRWDSICNLYTIETKREYLTNGPWSMSMRWRWTIYLCTLPYLVHREYTWPMVHNQCTWSEGGPYIYALCLTWSIKGLALFLSQVIYTLYPIQWFVRVTLLLSQVIYKTTWFVAYLLYMFTLLHWKNHM